VQNPLPVQSTHQKQDEKILVVPTQKLSHLIPFFGFQPIPSFDSFAALINQEKKFEWRSAMEEDPSYKQIIPYLIFSHNKKYFLMQRKDNASEQRLKSKYSLGIGGHIREEDITGKSIAEWAQREFHEEVIYNGSLTIHPIGIINDERNAVGKVHVGFAFLICGSLPNISVRSELKHGELLASDACEQFHPHMETWSQLVFDYLKAKGSCHGHSS